MDIVCHKNMVFTKHGLYKLGFRPFNAGESLTARFVRRYLYEAQGLSVDPLSEVKVEERSDKIDAIPFRIVYGNEENTVYKSLMGDPSSSELTNEPKGWFVGIQLGPTQEYTISEGLISTRDWGEDCPKNGVLTYNSFPYARAELDEMERIGLPKIIASIACKASIKLTKIEETYRLAGRTSDGRWILDFIATGGAEAGIRSRVAPQELFCSIQEAIIDASTLDAETARFFTLGLEEKNPFQRFSHFYRSIEAGTHARFNQIDGELDYSSAIKHLGLSQPPSIVTIRKRPDRHRILKDEFIWCVIEATMGNVSGSWNNVSGEDIDQFMLLKETRDRLSHVRSVNSSAEDLSLVNPSAEDLSRVEKLARKILRGAT